MVQKYINEPFFKIIKNASLVLRASIRASHPHQPIPKKKYMETIRKEKVIVLVIREGQDYANII